MTGRLAISGGQRWARNWLIGLLITASLADFIANDIPIMASAGGSWYFPVAAQVVNASSTHPKRWKQKDVDWAIWPPIRYSGTRSGAKREESLSPFSSQCGGILKRHWLGTDNLGRDILAGVIHGTRPSVLVGFGSLIIAFLIGVPLGGLAGFFGDRRWSGMRATWWGICLGGIAGVAYAWLCLVPYTGVADGLGVVLLLVSTAAVFATVTILFLRQFRMMRATVTFPIDTIVLQAMELFVSIPGIIFLLAVIAISNTSSIGLLILVVGVLNWTFCARFLRAELLRVRSLPYIEAAYNSGVPRMRILWRHALPNAIGPLVVVAGFMVGSAMLAEAYLSFLGIGVPEDVITWGKLMRYGREQPKAWWIALFPGLMLTITILAIQVGFRK